MGKKILVTVIASLLTASSICLAGNVYAQPKEVTWKIYLPGHQIKSVYATDKYIYAGEGGQSGTGVFSSKYNDIQLSFQKIFNNAFVYSVYSNNDDIYVGTNDGIYVIDNDGTQKLHALSGKEVISLYVFKGVIYAGTFNNGLYIKRPGETEWEYHKIGMNNISAIYSLNDTVYVGDKGATFEGGLYRSTDEGVNWESVTGMSNMDISSIFVSNGIIYVTSLESLYISTDNGENWIKYYTSPRYVVVNSVFVSDGIIYLGTADGILTGQIEQNKWEELSHLLSGSNKDVTSVFVLNGRIYAGILYDFSPQHAVGLYVSQPPTPDLL